VIEERLKAAQAVTPAASRRRRSRCRRGLDYSVWRDSDLPSHRPYGDVIEEQLSLAKAVVVVWSADALPSDYVHSKADRARAERKSGTAADRPRAPTSPGGTGT
jgi:hypothetical protein